MYYNWCQVTGGILSMENWYGLSPLFKWRFSKNLWILINFRASSLNWDETRQTGKKWITEVTKSVGDVGKETNH